MRIDRFESIAYIAAFFGILIHGMNMILHGEPDLEDPAWRLVFGVVLVMMSLILFIGRTLQYQHDRICALESRIDYLEDKIYQDPKE